MTSTTVPQVQLRCVSNTVSTSWGSFPLNLEIIYSSFVWTDYKRHLLCDRSKMNFYLFRQESRYLFVIELEGPDRWYISRNFSFWTLFTLRSRKDKRSTCLYVLWLTFNGHLFVRRSKNRTRKDLYF